MDDVAGRLGRNMRTLREARTATQAQMAKLAGLPRATWANLESGMANPTLAVLDRVATAFQVTIEELIAAPRSAAQRFTRDQLAVRTRGTVTVRKLLPDPVAGIEMERLELPPKAKMIGVPHTPGTREYLACETGAITLVASGEQYRLDPGDVVVFRGDQRHSYVNEGPRPAVAYSFVIIARR